MQIAAQDYGARLTYEAPVPEPGLLVLFSLGLRDMTRRVRLSRGTVGSGYRVRERFAEIVFTIFRNRCSRIGGAGRFSITVPRVFVDTDLEGLAVGTI